MRSIVDHFSNYPPEDVTGWTIVNIPDSISTRTLLDIVYWIGHVEEFMPPQVNINVDGNTLYFKDEAEAIMFRLKFGV